MSTPERQEPDILAEFAAFLEEFAGHILPPGMPEHERRMWEELRR